MEHKPQPKRKEIIVQIVVSFIGALIINFLSLLFKFSPTITCRPLQCLGELKSLEVSYGLPFHYIGSFPAHVQFYFDKFIYNFIIYFFIIFIVCFVVSFVKKGLKNN